MFWYILYYQLAPKIEFSEAITKRKSQAKGCGYEYAVKLYNVRHRTAIDARLQAFVTTPNLTFNGSDDVYYLSIGTNRILEIISKSKPGRNANLVIFNLDKERFTKVFERHYFPEQIRICAADKKLSLEDILDIKENSRLCVRVKLTDSVSGATRVYRSKDYTQNDIVLGYFRKGSLEAIPMHHEQGDTKPSFN
jgi:hypothetical protein